LVLTIPLLLKVSARCAQLGGNASKLALCRQKSVLLVGIALEMVTTEQRVQLVHTAQVLGSRLQVNALPAIQVRTA
jgi:hypothetical protein